MFDDLFHGFIGLFGDYFNDIFIGLIVALSIYWYAKYDLIRLSGIKRSLERLNDRISGLEGYDAGNIQKLDRIFSAQIDEGLKNAWEACYHDFRHIMNREKTLDIKEYFDPYGVITLPARRKRAEAVPGVISMLGILGTFLSILSGTSNLEVPAVSSAFSIAAAAFIFAILFVLLDRQLYQSTLSELKAFLGLVGRKIPMASESGSLETLIREQRGQKEAIENMAADISTQLGNFIHKELVPTIYKSFDESINRQIAPSIKAMCDTICRVSELTANTQTKGMQELVNSFANRLMSSMGLEFEKFKESFNVFLATYEKVQQNTNELVRKISENVDMQNEVNNRTRLVTEGLANSQNQAAEMVLSVAGNMEKLQSFSEEVRNVLKLDKEYADELNSQRQQLVRQSGEYLDKMDQEIYRLIDELNIQLEGAFTRFNEITGMAFEQMDSIFNASMENISNNLKALADGMDDQVRDISIYARGLSEEIGELNATLSGSVKEFGNQINEGVTRTLDNFDAGLAEICGRLGNTIFDIREAVDEIPPMLEVMRNVK